MEATDSHSTPSDAQAQSTQRIWQKKDIAWKYIIEVRHDQGKKILICEFCRKPLAGGGLNRMKQHLIGVKGQVEKYSKKILDVQNLVAQSLQENIDKAQEKWGFFNKKNLYGQSVHNFEGDKMQESLYLPTKGNAKGGDGQSSKEKRKANYDIQNYFKLGVHDPFQPTIKACLQSPERCHDIDLSIVYWFYHACIIIMR